jgi:hypothetical protein
MSGDSGAEDNHLKLFITFQEMRIRPDTQSKKGRSINHRIINVSQNDIDWIDSNLSKFNDEISTGWISKSK